ncbi:MAG: class I SAM-dependent methyltransferase [Bacteroidota bacterium]
MIERRCPVCNSEGALLFRQVYKYSYYECNSCEVIFLEPEILAKIDRGESLVDYNGSYWTEELFSARQRSWGSALARVAELFLYARIPIKKFVDIGSGPGYLLDALAYQLPSSSDIFYANELFPPAAEYCTKSKNYLKGSLLDLDFSFDAGCCIEVIEHLTPAMVKQLFHDLAIKSAENRIYVFNTGLSQYVKNEDINYLDPILRGHIVSWSVKGLQCLVEDSGFRILPIPGKTWAMIAEFKPTHQFDGTLQDRIWQAVPENVNVLKDIKTGDLLYILGIETARAYG